MRNEKMIPKVVQAIGTCTAIKDREGLLAGSWSAKKREDEISDCHRYWYVSIPGVLDVTTAKV